ncbi:MAG: iron-sulfur cluster assembly accessory protein [Pseudomonadota bacterium]
MTTDTVRKACSGPTAEEKANLIEVDQLEQPAPEVSLSLSITDAAARHICDAMADAEGEALGVRVSVKKAGCSGYEYILEYAYELGPMDYSVTHQGAHVVIDKAQLAKFMNGSVVDYRKEGVNEGIVFENPRATATCGCGESFTLGA